METASDGLSKPRVLLVTANPPMNEMGGCLLLYRQFVEREDYEYAVVTTRPDYEGNGERWMRIEAPRWLERLTHTRLANWGHDYQHLFRGKRVPAEVERFAREFQPDLVMTGMHNWVGDLGISIGKRLQIPVAGYFMDWASYAALGHPWMIRYLSKIYRKRYRKCDLALGICPEMLEALGPHPNPAVFYPSGTGEKGRPWVPGKGKDFTVFFGGNLGQWYGKALSALSDQLAEEPGIQLRVAGRNASWDKASCARMEARGELLGYLDKAGLEEALESADVLLVIMGFDEESRQIESTSFKSKLVDYLQKRRPVVVWGPEYCTAVRHARREGFGEAVMTPDARAVVKTLKKLAQKPERCHQLVEAGERFYDTYLDGRKVMGDTLQVVRKLLANRSGGPAHR